MSVKAMDKYKAQIPVDSVALKVMLGGEDYVSAKCYGNTRHWKNMPPTRNVVRGTTNLSGTTFGRFMVVGLSAHKNLNKHAVWVVRCICGDYEVRSAKAMKNLDNKDDCCLECKHVRKMKNGEYKHWRGMMR